jgi:rfaE bifunctional protein nucleotidyltransferase chain/domain
VKVVLCHGVFDLLHRGHVVHLREAKEFGDRLVVSLVADKYVRKPWRPVVYEEEERMALLSAIRYVDEVVLCEAPGPEAVIAALRPDVYVRGPDYIGKRMPEDVTLRECGIPVRYTPSSFRRTTEIIERIWRDKPLFAA